MGADTYALTVMAQFRLREKRQVRGPEGSGGGGYPLYVVGR